MASFNDVINSRASTDEGNSISKSSGRYSFDNEDINKIEKIVKASTERLKITEKLLEAQEKLSKMSEDEEGYSKQKQRVEELYDLQQKRVAEVQKQVEKNYYASLSMDKKAEFRRAKALEAESKKEEAAQQKRYAKKMRDSFKDDKNSDEYKQWDKEYKKARDDEKFARAQEKNEVSYFKKLEKAAQEQLALAQTDEEREQAQADLDKAREAKEDARQNKRDALLKGIKDVAEKGLSENSRIAKEILTSSAQYASRLQGYTKNYAEILNKINKQIGLNPFVSQEKMITNLNSLLDRGIAYNIEQRSFLATISDKVAATFDKQNETLERLIRIQQADSTAARLGLEASLTKLFNGWFEDTSYLASTTFDQVTSALIEAESQMTRDQAVEFEYTIQKWLGSLYSLGLSQSAVTNIAGGLGQLASGNISALQGTPLQTLFALSASRSGLSYSDMLINSIDGSSINALMKAMVEYLKEIAEGSNQVVKSAYGGIFNLSQSDFRALSNITNADITNLSKLTSTYTSAINEVQEQLTFSNLSSRSTMAEMIQNVINNFKWNWGSETAASPVVSAMVQINDIINEMTSGSGIPIPTILGFGTGFFANTNLNNLITAVGQAATLIGSIGNIASAFGSGMGLDLSQWDAKEFTSRGSGFSGIKSGFRSGTSLSQYVTSGSASDMEQGTLEEQSKRAKDIKKTTGVGDDNKDFPKSDALFDDLFKTPTYGMRTFLSDYTEGNAVRTYMDFKTLTNVQPFSTIIANQQTTIDRLGINDKNSALAEIYAILNDKIAPKISKSNAKIDIDTVDLTNKLSSVISNMIIGGVEGEVSPEEVALKDVLLTIYEQITSGGMRVDVRNVDRSVPGFGGMQALRVKEIL